MAPENTSRSQYRPRPGVPLGAALAAAALTLALLPPAPAGAQEEAAQAGFFETVDVEIVNVEVFVTDRRGNPVQGLRAEDFEVFHDGEPVEITNFYVSSAERRSDEASGLERIDTSVRRRPARIDPIEQRLNLVLFIDNRNLEPKNRNRVIDALRGSLFFNLRRQDRVTLVSYDGALDIRQGLTGNPHVLVEALEEMAGRGATGLFQRAERASILRELQRTDLESDVASVAGGNGLGSGAGADFEGILQRIRYYTQEEYLRTASTVEAMARFVDALSGLPGRKALVYVSDGLSLRPGEALYKAFANKAPDGLVRGEIEAREYDATRLFEELGKLANSSRVTFYTILAAGGSAPTLTPAERGAFANVGSGPLGQVWSEELDSIERGNFNGSMQILAEATGGLATVSTRNFGDALRRVQKDLSTFYSIGYVPPEKDFDSHRIEVDVKHPGLEVRHRETFRLRSGDEEMQVRTHAALLFAEPENPLGVRVEFGLPQLDQRDLYLVPVIVKFPIANVVLAPRRGKHEGQVSIFVGARDVEQGDVSPVQKVPAPISVPDDQLQAAREQVAGYRLMLQLRGGEHAVAVSIRDEIAQVESTAVVNFDATRAIEAAKKKAAAKQEG